MIGQSSSYNIMTTYQTLPSVTRLSRLDRTSPVPLYHQLRLTLEEWARSRQASSEDCLPTEAELSEMFGVSRITVRQALASMLADGILYRKRARGRIFLAPPKVHQHLTRLSGFFTDDLLAAGLEPSTRVLSVERLPADTFAERLQLDKAATIFKIERLHEGNGQPMAFQASYVPEAVCPNLDRLDCSRSIFRLLQESGRPIARGIQRVWVRPASKRERELLILGRQAEVIDVERLSVDPRGIPVEYFAAALRTDRYDFVMELGQACDARGVASSIPNLWPARSDAKEVA